MVNTYIICIYTCVVYCYIPFADHEPILRCAIATRALGKAEKPRETPLGQQGALSSSSGALGPTMKPSSQEASCAEETDAERQMFYVCILYVCMRVYCVYRHMYVCKYVCIYTNIYHSYITLWCKMFNLNKIWMSSGWKKRPSKSPSGFRLPKSSPASSTSTSISSACAEIRKSPR